MAILIKPTNDAGRVGILDSSAKTGTSDVTKGKKYLSDETLQLAKDLAAEYSNLLKAEAGKLASRSKEVREKNAAMLTLETCMRDMWEVIKRRVFRKNEPAEVFT